MEIDIKIYLNSLRGFFKSANIPHRNNLRVSEEDLERLMSEIEVVARKNYTENHDPTLSRNQMLEIIANINGKKIPQIGINNTYFAVPQFKTQIIKGFGEISIKS